SSGTSCTVPANGDVTLPGRPDFTLPSSNGSSIGNRNGRPVSGHLRVWFGIHSSGRTWNSGKGSYGLRALPGGRSDMLAAGIQPGSWPGSRNLSCVRGQVTAIPQIQSFGGMETISPL